MLCRKLKRVKKKRKQHRKRCRGPSISSCPCAIVRGRSKRKTKDHPKKYRASKFISIKTWKAYVSSFSFMHLNIFPHGSRPSASRLCFAFNGPMLQVDLFCLFLSFVDCSTKLPKPIFQYFHTQDKKKTNTPMPAPTQVYLS